MKNIIRSLKIVVPIAPFRMVIYLLLSLPCAILPAVMLHLQQGIVDRAARMDPTLPLSGYLLPVALLIGVYMALKLFDLLSRQYMEFGYFRYVLLGLDGKIHGKSASIPLEYYDDAGYFQTVEEAKQGSMFLVFTANLAILSVILIFNLLSVGGYLAVLHPLLIVFVILVSLPVVLEKVKEAKYQSALIRIAVQPNRRKKYILDLLCSPDRKKEIAHHGAGDRFVEKYRTACREADAQERVQISRMGRIGLLLGLAKGVCHGGALFLMVWLLMSGGITIGGFSVLLSSFAVLTGAFTQLFNHVGEIMQTGMMTESFFTLMDLPVSDGAEALPSSPKAIRLEGVCYRYPNGAEDALKGISLTIRQGERIAIVGKNGAGKTTLAKLLSGFLLPSQGEMTLDGTDRRRLKEDGLFAQISAVYQNFGRYQLSLAQNVCLGDTARPADPEGIREALEWADVDGGPSPESVQLGREFGGAGLSGGQWQRVALARCRYRQRPILFFDEPTAAIDPLEEMRIYEKLEALAQGRTVILVTHRLGAVRTADRILVMEDGRITESGTFRKLAEAGGRFSQLWSEQAKWYHDS